MSDFFPPATQRPKLLAFAEACCTRASALPRDECGDWAIFGNNGHIYAVPEGFQLMIGCDPEPRWSSAKGWESTKRRLSFAKLTQDGDEEGAFILDRLPTMAEATEIRMVLGIPKRRALDDDLREKLIQAGVGKRGKSRFYPPRRHPRLWQERMLIEAAFCDDNPDRVDGPAIGDFNAA